MKKKIFTFFIASSAGFAVGAYFLGRIVMEDSSLVPSSSMEKIEPNRFNKALHKLEKNEKG